MINVIANIASFGILLIALGFIGAGIIIVAKLIIRLVT
jgi:hypothetical protein